MLADLIMTGDHQPAEPMSLLSWRMLEVCLEPGFSVSVLSRSPLVLRDLDLLQAISEKAIAAVMFSIISTPDSAGYERERQMDLRPGPGDGKALRRHGAHRLRQHLDRHVHDAHPAAPV